MNTPKGGPGNKIQYNFTIGDIEDYFSKNNLKPIVKYITHYANEIERTPEAIQHRLNEIKTPGFNESRRRTLNESKQDTLNSIVKYLKGPGELGKLNNICTHKLPTYITGDDVRKIKPILASKDILKNFKAMCGRIDSSFYTNHSKQDTMKTELKIVKLFYNARLEHTEIYQKAKTRFDEEVLEREGKNNTNDVWEKYEDIESPENTAQYEIYTKFFLLIDPQRKFTKRNREIFTIFCKIFKVNEHAYNEENIHRGEIVDTQRQRQKEEAEKLIQSFEERSEKPKNIVVVTPTIEKPIIVKPIEPKQTPVKKQNKKEENEMPTEYDEDGIPLTDKDHVPFGRHIKMPDPHHGEGCN